MKTEYVRLTFKPAGSLRRVTVWAIRGNKPCFFWRCNKHGEEPDPQELIICAPKEETVHVRPATMSLKYAELEVTTDA